MSVWELIAVAAGLAMDAFAVSICKGLSMKRFHYKSAWITGLYFGGFQALMPFLGFLLGIRFRDLVSSYDQWVAFFLLSLIGVKMLRESRHSFQVTSENFCAREMIGLAIATSIDAMAVGVTFAFMDVTIWIALSIIGSLTFLLSFAGVRIGHAFGSRLQAKAEVAGGMVLILIGLKILLVSAF